MYTLAIDTGKHLAAALLQDDELIGMHYQHKECFRKEQVTELITDLRALCDKHDIEFNDINLVIEVPSHRYFGRANSSSLLKAFWQTLWIVVGTMNDVNELNLIPAPEWNKQRNDKDKKRSFLNHFESYKSIPYYQEKHGSRSNVHERDAANFGLWYYRRKGRE